MGKYLTGHDILFFSGSPWEFHWQRHQEFMIRFARKNNRIFYIQPFGNRTYSLQDYMQKLSVLANRFRGSVVRNVERKVSNLKLISVYVFPFHTNKQNSLFRRLNEQLSFHQIRRLVTKYSINRPIFWANIPSDTIIDLIGKLDEVLVVYDCVDNYAVWHPGMAYLVETEQIMLRQADIIFATAEKLYQQCISVNKNTHRIPAGVNITNYLTDTKDTPLEMRNIEKPIIGYIGTMKPSFFDFDLIHSIATFKPKWNLVLIGEDDHVPVSIKSLNSVHFLGHKPYEAMPQYIHSFDVCLLPYQVNDYTKFVYPTKLLEYLACGKPVVSWGIPEVKAFSEVVDIAESPADFVALIEKNLQPQSQKERERKIEIAAQNTWDKRFAELNDKLSATLAWNEKK